MNYSQGDEQRYILEVLGYEVGAEATPLGVMRGEKPGRLLEIGAYHATELSNSRALIELGWSAVLFEPSPGPLKGLVQEYGDNPRVEVVGLPVSIRNEFLKLRVTDDAVSADARNGVHLATWKDHGFYGTMTTWAVSIFSVLNGWGPSNGWGPFDFISIDTEGTSVDLFVEMLHSWNALPKPRCICVEHNNRWDELKAAADAAGYEGVFRNGENLVLKLRGKP